jgi:hypothetical protein
VGRFLLEFLREIDDLNRIEWALFDTDTAGLAQTDLLGNDDLIGFSREWFILVMGVLTSDNTFLTSSVRRTKVCTLIVTPIGLTSVEVNHCDTVVSHQKVVPVVRKIVQQTNQRENVINAI